VVSGDAPEPGRVVEGEDLREVRERELAALEVPTLTPRAQQIVEVALELLEEGGSDAVSMRVVAGRLGVRAPSLYKHLPDKGAMENAMIAIGLRRQGAAMEEAASGADDPLWAVVQAFRRWGKDHRHLYELMMAAPLDPGPLVRSAELVAGRALRDAMQGDALGAFTVWSFSHGLLTLELQGRLPPGVDVELLWQRGIDALRPR
jgi:AcrR family transcriptional regulator